MSDSWICWKPRIDEPSNATPSLNTVSSNDCTGTLKCCITPSRSQKRTSTKRTPSVSRYRRSSSGLANTRPPSCRARGELVGSWRGGRPVTRDPRVETLHRQVSIVSCHTADAAPTVVPKVATSIAHPRNSRVRDGGPDLPGRLLADGAAGGGADQ